MALDADEGGRLGELLRKNVPVGMEFKPPSWYMNLRGHCMAKLVAIGLRELKSYYDIMQVSGQLVYSV